MSQGLFEDALAAEGVSGKLADLARSIYVQESREGRNSKTSNRGAVGGMQVMPGTFTQVADKDWDIADPMHNARAGIRYLKFLDKKAGGNPELTAAGYYGGPGGLEKARRGVAVSDPQNPQAPNTLQYGREVVARMSGWGAGAPQARPQPPVAAPVQAQPAPVVAAAPAEVPTQATQAGGRGVPLPQELVQYLASRATQLGGQTVDQANAWLSFLKAMPQQTRRVAVAPAAAPATAGIAPQDIDWAGALRPVAQPSGRVDFSAFTGFGRAGSRA